MGCKRLGIGSCTFRPPRFCGPRALSAGVGEMFCVVEKCRCTAARSAPCRFVSVSGEASFDERHCVQFGGPVYSPIWRGIAFPGCRGGFPRLAAYRLQRIEATEISFATGPSHRGVALLCLARLSGEVLALYPMPYIFQEEGGDPVGPPGKAVPAHRRAILSSLLSAGRPRAEGFRWILPICLLDGSLGWMQARGRNGSPRSSGRRGQGPLASRGGPTSDPCSVLLDLMEIPDGLGPCIFTAFRPAGRRRPSPFISRVP